MKKPQDYLLFVIEDDQKARHLMIEVVKGMGFKVKDAETGAQAMELFESSKPDLILMDGILPDITGFDLVRNIKERNELKDIPVIMTTALDDPQHIREAIEIGANAYVTKPINISRLREKIYSHLDINSN